MRKLVIIPTYNEIENISAMIDKVFSLEESFDLLIIALCIVKVKSRRPFFTSSSHRIKNKKGQL